MARYTGPRVRISRRFGVPIFGPTKYLERRNYGPGMHGPKSRRKHTDYALGLIEKQKLRYYYGLMERQFRGVYERALKRRGVTGEHMLQILETRLDNVCVSSRVRQHARRGPADGFARSCQGERTQGERSVLRLESERCDRGKELECRRGSWRQGTWRSPPAAPCPDWLSLNKDEFKGVVMRIPTRDEIQPIANEQAVVEFYSR